MTMVGTISDDCDASSDAGTSILQKVFAFVKDTCPKRSEAQRSLG